MAIDKGEGEVPKFKIRPMTPEHYGKVLAYEKRMFSQRVAQCTEVVVQLGLAAERVVELFQQYAEAANKAPCEPRE